MAPFASGYKGPKGGGGGIDSTLNNGGNDVVVLDYGNRDHVFAGRMVAAAAATTNVVAIENVERHTRPTAVVSSAVKRKDALKGEETKKNAISGRRVESFEATKCVLEDLFFDHFGWIKDDDDDQTQRRNVFVVEPILCSRRERERLCQMLFEEFRVSGYCAENAGVCALAGIGRLNGISVDIGAETIDCATISDGKIVESSCRRIEGGGERCCELALNAIREGEEIYTQMEKWERMVVNRNVARVRCSADDEGKEDGMESYQLPDGNKISMETKDAFAIGDALYCCSSSTSSDVAEGKCSKIIEAIQSAVENSFSHAQAGHFYSNGKDKAFECVVAHGTESSVKGLRERLGKDIQTNIAPESAKVNVVASAPDYFHDKSMEHLSWTGGAVLGKVTWNLNQQISKSAYDEWGPNVANRNRSSI